MLNNIFKYKKKGNISILVIFVLLASSLIGVLTMNFLKQMIGYTNNIYSHHKSYYLAKAGLELALIQINNAGIGFSNSIGPSSNLFLDNFDCQNCGFDLKIKGKTKYLSDKFWISTGCDDKNAFLLKGGESLVIPFFTQRDMSNNFELFNDEILYNKDILQYRNYFKFKNNKDFSFTLNLGLVFLSGSDIQRDYSFIKSMDVNENILVDYFQDFQDYYGSEILDSTDYFSYLILSNPSNDFVSFCIYVDHINLGGKKIFVELPTTKFLVISLGSFMDKTIGLQAIYGQPIPGFLSNTYLQ